MITKIVFLLTFLPLVVFAQAQVYPTRIILSDEATSSYVNIKNPLGNAQKFRIELAQFVMKSDGSMSKQTPIQSELLDIVKFSPKSVVIAPGEKQVVRLMVSALDTLSEGDHYIHLQFLPEDEEASKNQEKRTSFSLRAKIAVAIPIIVRRGTPVTAPKLTSLSAIEEKDGQLTVDFNLSNSTKYFLTGDLDIYGLADKEEILLSKTSGLSSYLSERKVKMVIKPNEKNEKINEKLFKKIKVRYASNLGGGSDFELFAETELQTPLSTALKGAPHKVSSKKRKLLEAKANTAKKPQSKVQ